MPTFSCNDETFVLILYTSLETCFLGERENHHKNVDQKDVSLVIVGMSTPLPTKSRGDAVFLATVLLGFFKEKVNML